MINTFYKKNILRFTNESKTQEFNSKIAIIEFDKVEKIDIDSSILNELIFENINCLFISGEVLSIQKGLLRSFKKLNQLSLGPYYARKLFQRGISWIHDLNSDIKIDIKNISEVSAARIFYFEILTSFAETLGHYSDKSMQSTLYVFPDEDFCIYKDFPFDQLVILQFYHSDEHETCTFMWLIQYYKYYKDANFSIFTVEYMLERNFSQKVNNCDFEKR